jgi:hypothetical protein
MWPKIWGGITWDTLYFFILNYPDTPNDVEKNKMSEFFTLFCYHLPCPVCKYHAMLYIRENPVNTENKESLELYLLNFHNNINIRLNKKALKLQTARQDLFERRVRPQLSSYETTDIGESESNSDQNKNVTIILISLVSILFIMNMAQFIFYRKSRTKYK